MNPLSAAYCWLLIASAMIVPRNATPGPAASAASAPTTARPIDTGVLSVAER
jgi:hypothetical protein